MNDRFTRQYPPYKYDKNKVRDLQTGETYTEINELIPVLNDLYFEKIITENSIDDIRQICNKYNLPLNDVAETLEEYILVDNEILESKQIKNTVKEAYQQERTELGKTVLKQLWDRIQ